MLGISKYLGVLLGHTFLLKRGKNLEPKIHSCLLMGCSEESKAYRLYDLTTKKIFASRDVKFDKHSQLSTTYFTTTNAPYINKDEVCTNKTTNTCD